MRLLKTILVITLVALTTTACAHHPHHDGWYDNHRSSRITIWGDNFAIDWRESYHHPRSHRHFHHQHHRRGYHSFGFPTTKCRTRWDYGGSRFHHGIRIETYNRACVIRIPSSLSMPNHQRPPSFIMGDFCVQQNISRRSVDSITLREHKFSPPINCH